MVDRESMKSSLAFVLVLLGSLVLFAPSDNGSDLEGILEKCAEYCERLDKISLYFVCEEKITETIYGRAFPNEKNTYIYDYQLRRFGGAIDEQRILLKENGRQAYQKNAKLNTKRFSHKYIVFGPIGLLSWQQQPKYNYTIIKEVNYKGTKAVLVEATPKFPEAFDALYGKIWIGKEDFSILKIEWNPESMGNYKGIEETAKKYGGKPKILFATEFGFEKNKIRFPNKYYVEEIYILRNGRRFTRSKITVTYDNYKFFTVETNIKYQ